ncbi:MAG: PEP/pyruvate-binding domain-containing protein, partial [Bacteroidota bacterium]
EDFRVAVRSSGLDEDGPQASYAGQYATELNVPPNGLGQAVLSVLASAFSPGLQAYRSRQGASTPFRLPALIFQAMVPAQRSGVGFSMDVQGNLAQALIVAGLGLGEGVVADKVATDSYWVDRQTRQLTRQCAAKETQWQAQAEGGVAEAPVALAAQAHATLTDAEALVIFDCLLKAEEAIGNPADIEFAWDPKGTLYILQARPITTIRLEELVILDNTNIVESYPGITLPLTYSFALQSYETVFRSSAEAFGLSRAQKASLAAVFPELLAHHQGRIYYRLDNWYRMIAVVFPSLRSRKAWENAVGLKDPQRSRKRRTGQIVKMLGVSMGMLLQHRRRSKVFFSHFNEAYASFRQDPVDTHPKGWWQHYEQHTQELFRYWYVTIVNDFLAFKAFDALCWAVRKALPLGPDSLPNDLIAHQEWVESEEAVLAMLRLKEQVLASAALQKLFEEEKPETILVRLQSEKQWQEGFFPKLCAYIDRFGDRNLAELKLENPSFRQEPTLCIQLLQQQLASDLQLADYQKAKQLREERAWATVQASLWRYHPRYLLIKWLARRAKRGLANRENMRFCRTRAYGRVKEVFAALGQHMAQQGILKDPKEVNFLTVEQLKAYAQGQVAQPFRLAKLQATYQEYQTANPPDRVIYPRGKPPRGSAVTTPTASTHPTQGLGVSPGEVRAPVVVITTPSYDLDVRGKILVTRMTDPGWVFLMTQAAGIISEKGSLLSHTAIVGRELGIPVVVDVPQATQWLTDGTEISLNGHTGTITLHSPILSTDTPLV